MKEAFDFLSDKDPVFKKIIETYGLPPIPIRVPGFLTLALLILEQQVSIDSAKATFQKLLAKVDAFKPANLAILSDEHYREAGVSRQKTSYIKGLSLAILDNKLDVESLAFKPPQQVRDELIQIKGIGNWTIDVYLMFSLGAPDVIPLGDIAVVNTLKELFNIHDKNDAAIFTDKWSPHRSFATFLLWHYYLQKRGRQVEY